MLTVGGAGKVRKAGRAEKPGKAAKVAGEEVFVIFFKDFCKAKQKTNRRRRRRRGLEEVTSQSPKSPPGNGFWSRESGKAAYRGKGM